MVSAGEVDMSSNPHHSEVNPKESEFSPYKPNEYRLYLAWKALPINSLNCEKVTAEFSIENWEIEQLAGIKTQNDFAERFGLHPSTLSEWNNQPIPLEYAHLDWRNWAKSLTKEVVMTLFNGIIEYGDAARVRLWFQFIDPTSTTEDEKKGENEVGRIFNIKDMVEQAERILKENGEM